MSYFFFFIFLLFNNINSLKINTKPNSNYYKNNLPLFWKITKKNNINKDPQRYIFNDYPIAS